MTVATTARAVKRAPKKLRHNGYVLWSGRSPEDDKPIYVVALGFVVPSRNPKTGPMIQVLTMRSDVPPHVAVTTGDDVSVCNDCELRQYTVKRAAEALGLKPGQKPPMCYVTTSNSLRAVHDAYERGMYPEVERDGLDRLFAKRMVRLGAYGNFSNVPLSLTKAVIAPAGGWTLYEHNWRHKRAQPLKRYAMASVSSPEAKAEANELGWRTFRMKRPDQPVLKDELVCPASEEAGHKTTCDRCLLCCGTSKKAKNIVIDDHGPTSMALRNRQMVARLGLIKR